MSINLTELVFILDRSGSMGGLEKDTIGGYNSMLEKQKELGETRVTTVLFDDKYELLWQQKPVEAAKLSPETYYVRGMTALLDAVGKTIIEVGQRLANTKKEHRPDKVIVAITTDGLENASEKFTYSKVKELIQHQENKYKWEFIFMGANIDVNEEADKLGINHSNAFCYEASEAGLDVMYNSIDCTIKKMRSK